MPPSGKAVASELLGKSAGTLAKAAGNEVADNGARDTDGIDSVMIVKARILARQESIHEVIGNFVEGDDHPVLAGQTAVEFPVLVVDGRTLRHVADRLQIERQRPRVEEERDDRPKKNDHHRSLEDETNHPPLKLRRGRAGGLFCCVRTLDTCLRRR